MNALVPKNLNKNEVKRQRLWRSAPVSFVPASAELPTARDNDKQGQDQWRDPKSVFWYSTGDAFFPYVGQPCAWLVHFLNHM